MNEAEKKAARAAAETDGADDPILPAGAVRRHSRADGHQDRGDAVTLTARAVSSLTLLSAEALA
jgi:hypothetical protein